MIKLISNTAYLTIQEIFQSRVYQLLLIVSLCTPIVAYLLSSLFLVDIGKVYMDGVLGMFHLVSLVFVLFLAASILARDIERKVCYLFVVPPANRGTYLFGRFFGFMFIYYVMSLLLILVSVASAEVIFKGVDALYLSGYTPFNLFLLLFLHSLQYVALLGFAFFIASWATGLAEVMFFALMGFLISWILPSILGVINPASGTEQGSAILYAMLSAVYLVLPHLNAAEASLMLVHGNVIEKSDVILFCLDHVSYTAVFFGLAIWFFQRRDL